jgi:hypothetical protein
MIAIGGQPAPIAGDYIDSREIAHQGHGYTAGAGKARKLYIKRIPAGHTHDPAPLASMGGHDRARLIALQANQIAHLRDYDLRAIGSGIYPHRQGPGFQGAISLSRCSKPDKSQESSNAANLGRILLAPNRGMGYQDRP